jgi:NTE family protein
VGASIGLVLSGGGARGAYEVGALCHIADALPELLARIRIVTGSSVGAVNAAYLASRGLTPGSVRDLAGLWRGLQVDELVSLSHLSALRMVSAAPLRLMRIGLKSPATGLLDARRLWRLVAREIEWAQIRHHVEQGRFDAVALAATDIGRGETHVFLDARPELSPPEPTRISDFVAVPTQIDLRHVLASAAIPLLFPPVELDGRWYMDGGVRLNTPLGPALRMGAESLLIVNTRGVETSTGKLGGYPGIGQVVGKLLDAVFLDRVGYDLDRLTRINDVATALEHMEAAEARAFRDRLEALGRARYRYVRFACVAPDADFGAMAARYVNASRSVGAFSFLRTLGALFEDDTRTSGDAASFLLFDGGYAAMLIEHGAEDAARVHEQLAAL